MIHFKKRKLFLYNNDTRNNVMTYKEPDIPGPGRDENLELNWKFPTKF